MNARMPAMPRAVAVVNICIESLVRGGPIPGPMDRLSPPEKREGYWHALETMATTVVERARGLPTPEYEARVRAIGITSCVLAQGIDAEGRGPGGDSNTLVLSRTAEQRRPEAVRLTQGMFDFFGILYRREVEELRRTANEHNPFPSRG